MMNKLFKTVLIVFIALFGFDLSAGPVLAQGIEISPEPVFETAGFLPGDSVNSTVSVKNNSDENYKSISIAGERIGSIENPDLAEMIDLEITSGSAVKNINLASLLNGEILIIPEGVIGGGGEKDYQFRAEFNKNAGNEYQNKRIEFNFLFTLEKKEENVTAAVSGMGGGGKTSGRSSFYIYDEEEGEVGQNNIVLAWNTNHPAFSQVIYDLYPGKFDLSAGKPAYGYAHFTSLTKKADVSHSVELTGLMPGTTYYYRLVSYTPYGSFAVSPEYSFTTLGQIIGEEEEPPFVPAPRPESGFAPTAEAEEDYTEPEQPFSMDEIEIPSEEEEDRRGILSAAASLFGAIGDWFSCIPWYLALIVALIITASAFLFKSIRQNRVKIVGTLIIALLLLLAIIFWFPCIPWYIILITIFLLPLIFLKP